MLCLALARFSSGHSLTQAIWPLGLGAQKRKKWKMDLNPNLQLFVFFMSFDDFSLLKAFCGLFSLMSLVPCLLDPTMWNSDPEILRRSRQF